MWAWPGRQNAHSVGRNAQEASWLSTGHCAPLRLALLPLPSPHNNCHLSADIICRFFDGFRREFDLPGTRHLHRVIRPNGAHAFLAQPDDNFVALERSLEEADGRQFDAEFFDQLMALFFGKPEGLPTR